jgi:hypothetical protein
LPEPEPSEPPPADEPDGGESDETADEQQGSGTEAESEESTSVTGDGGVALPATGGEAVFAQPLSLEPGTENDRRLRVVATSSESEIDDRGATAQSKFLYDVIGQFGDAFDIQTINFENMVLNQPALGLALDLMADEMSGSKTGEDFNAVVITQIATGTGMVLSVGFLGWILNGGALAASLLSTMPIWRGFDPLPLFAARDKSRSGDKRVMGKRRRFNPAEQTASNVERLFSVDDGSGVDDGIDDGTRADDEDDGDRA